MGCLPIKLRQRILDTIAKKEAQLAALEAAYDRAIGSSEVASYKFDSREGSQRTTLRKPSEIMNDIRTLESDISRQYRRLEGGGIVNLNLRRRQRWR